MAQVIVITRHPALVAYLVSLGTITRETPVVQHATEDDVRGKHVIGVLPLRLAALCRSVTEVPLDIPVELRGQELSIEQVAQFAGEPVRYMVSQWDTMWNRLDDIMSWWPLDMEEISNYLHPKHPTMKEE